MTDRVQTIRTSYANMIQNGDLDPGDVLPSLGELAQDHGVAMPTMELAFLHLKEDGLIVFEDGRPVVAETHTQIPSLPAPISLAFNLLEMFDCEGHIKMRVQCLTAETLISMLELIIRGIRASGGKRPKSLDLQLLLPASDDKLDIPYYVDDRDDEEARERLRMLIKRAPKLLDDLAILKEDGLVPELKTEIRTVSGTPGSKFYYLEWSDEEQRMIGSKVLYGKYQREAVLRDGRKVVDTFGWKARLFSYSGRDPFAKEELASYLSIWENETTR
ncbi:GntR family transcriptional regulator [Shimazuella sp. AN120528]|nr:GntR family transcriptional regulator [Shimazuella soli]